MDSSSILDAPLTLRDYWELLQIPALLATIAIAVTWVVWYFTSSSCSVALAESTGCNPSAVARYITLDALNKMIAHAIVGGGGGGLWSFAMITRERRAREAERKAREAERKAREVAEAQLAEERRRTEEERQRTEEERRHLLSIIEELSTNRNGDHQPNGGDSPQP